MALVCLISTFGLLGPKGGALGRRLASAASARGAVLASVAVGSRLPDATLFEGQLDYAKAAEHSLAALTAGKTAVIFAVPGAFTPGCSKSHLPSFVEGYAALRAAGVDEVICTATNDPYVMEAWGRASGVQPGTVRMLSDKEAVLCRALGVAVESGAMVRSERYALVARDGVVTAWLPAATPDGDKVSERTYCPAVLAALRG